jgi:DNA-binding XRE family transcriptional regulator
MNIDTVLLNWRKLSDLSINDAAALIGIPAHTLRRIERGRGMDVHTWHTIATWMLKPYGA